MLKLWSRPQAWLAPRLIIMPWSSKDASKKTKKANTPSEKEQWSKIANAVLKKTGSDARAVRTANAVISKNERNKGK